MKAALARWDPWAWLIEHPNVHVAWGSVDCPGSHDVHRRGLYRNGCDAIVERFADGIYRITLDPSLLEIGEVELALTHEIAHVVIGEWPTTPREQVDLERRVERWAIERMATR